MARLIKEVGRNYNTVILPEQLTTVAWASVTGTPTTIAGYGITDAIAGSGTANYIPKFATGTSLGNSVIYENSSNIGINNTNPLHKLHITQAADGNYPTLGTGKGAIFVAGDTNLYGLYVGINTTFGDAWLQAMRNNTATAYNLILQPAGGNVLVNQTTDSGERLQVTGSVKITSNLVVDTDTLYVDATNNTVSIGTTSNPDSYTLNVNGNGKFVTGVDIAHTIGFATINLGATSKTPTISGYRIDANNSELYISTYDGGTQKQITIRQDGDLELPNTILTGPPTGGTAQPWKLGQYNATAPTATGYIEVEVNGTLYKLLAAT